MCWRLSFDTAGTTYLPPQGHLTTKGLSYFRRHNYHDRAVDSLLTSYLTVFLEATEVSLMNFRAAI